MAKENFYPRPQGIRNAIIKINRRKCTRSLEDQFYETGFPTTADIAVHLDVARRTIHNWSKKDAEFDKFSNHLKTH